MLGAENTAPPIDLHLGHPARTQLHPHVPFCGCALEAVHAEVTLEANCQRILARKLLSKKDTVAQRLFRLSSSHTESGSLPLRGRVGRGGVGRALFVSFVTGAAVCQAPCPVPGHTSRQDVVPSPKGSHSRGGDIQNTGATHSHSVSPGVWGAHRRPEPSWAVREGFLEEVIYN